MKVDFEKWHGTKNDFILIHLDDRQKSLVFPSLQRAAPNLCRRDGAGIGADGILVVHDSLKAEAGNFEISIINADGSLAANCGNGIRCVAASIYRSASTEGRKSSLADAAFSVNVHQGARVDCQILPGTKGDHAFVSLGMDVAAIDGDDPKFPTYVAELRQKANDAGILLEKESISVVQTGNRHAVVLLNDETQRKQFGKFAAAAQNSALWDGINIHAVTESEITKEDQHLAQKLFQRPSPSRVNMIPWERGVGFTQSCGSGAVSVVAAACSKGILESHEWIAVGVPGGTLFARYDDSDSPALLAGPADLTFVGSFEL